MRRTHIIDVDGHAELLVLRTTAKQKVLLKRYAKLLLKRTELMCSSKSTLSVEKKQDEVRKELRREKFDLDDLHLAIFEFKYLEEK